MGDTKLDNLEPEEIPADEKATAAAAADSGPTQTTGGGNLEISGPIEPGSGGNP